MIKTRFLRRIWKRHSKLGRKRKKKQIWRKPTGRDNKMREKKKGHPKVVSIGYRKEQKDSGKIEGKIPFVVKNLSDLNRVGKNHVAVVGSIGKKKKIEIAKAAKEKKINLYNLNPKTFLRKSSKNDGKGKQK